MSEFDYIFTCFTCEQAFACRSDLLSHLSSHSDSKPFPCTLCGKAFLCRRDLDEHIQIHNRAAYSGHSAVPKEEEEEDTKEKLASGNFVQDMSDPSAKEASWICDFCDETFPSYEKLLAHSRNHLKEENSTIDIGDSSEDEDFREENDVSSRQNMQKKFSVSDSGARRRKGPYSCMVCERTFKYPAKLKVHLKRHLAPKEFVCNICHKHFSDKYILRNHKAAHTGAKPYVCEFCNRAFAWKPCMIVHRRTHTGEKPYKCEMCTWAFPTNTHLKRHVAEIHSNEKPFKCDVCDRAFSVKGRLKEHMKNHGDSPTLQALIDLGYFSLQAES